MPAVDDLAVSGGFADAVFDAQAVFSAVMTALSRPSRIVDCGRRAAPPEPLSAAAGAVLATLADSGTPVWLDPPLRAAPAVAAWIAFQTGAPIAEAPDAAAFAVHAEGTPLRFGDFAQGTDPYPDRSATLIAALPALEGGPALVLSGPGIDGEAAFAPRGLPDGFLNAWGRNHARFPCGVDLVLVCGDRLAALPRTTRIGRA